MILILLSLHQLQRWIASLDWISKTINLNVHHCLYHLLCLRQNQNCRLKALRGKLHYHLCGFRWGLWSFLHFQQKVHLLLTAYVILVKFYGKCVFFFPIKVVTQCGPLFLPHREDFDSGLKRKTKPPPPTTKRIWFKHHIKPNKITHVFIYISILVKPRLECIWSVSLFKGVL